MTNNIKFNGPNVNINSKFFNTSFNRFDKKALQSTLQHLVDVMGMALTASVVSSMRNAILCNHITKQKSLFFVLNDSFHEKLIDLDAIKLLNDSVCLYFKNAPNMIDIPIETFHDLHDLILFFDNHYKNTNIKSDFVNELGNNIGLTLNGGYTLTQSDYDILKLI